MSLFCIAGATSERTVQTEQPGVPLRRRAPGGGGGVVKFHGFRVQEHHWRCDNPNNPKHRVAHNGEPSLTHATAAADGLSDVFLFAVEHPLWKLLKTWAGQEMTARWSLSLAFALPSRPVPDANLNCFAFLLASFERRSQSYPKADAPGTQCRTTTLHLASRWESTFCTPTPNQCALFAIAHLAFLSW